MPSEDQELSGEKQAAFEQELAGLMRRVEAPPGFAAGVLHRLAGQEAPGQGRSQDHFNEQAGPLKTALSTLPLPGKQGAGGGLRVLPWTRAGLMSRLATAVAAGLTAALLLFLLVPAGAYLQQRRQHAQAEAATRQFVLAMRLTQNVLLDTGRQIAEHGSETQRPYQPHAKNSPRPTREEFR